MQLGKLQKDFNLSLDQLKQLFTLPHKVTLEPYVRAFQYKVLNSTLYTNSKLYKTGYSQQDLCTFCKSYPEKLNHLLHSCPCSKAFWDDFQGRSQTLEQDETNIGHRRREPLGGSEGKPPLPLKKIFKSKGSGMLF